MQLNPKLILFDLDGTLIDFHHDYLLDETARIIDHIGHPFVERSELEECFQLFDFFRFVREGFERDQFIETFWDKFNWNGFPAPKPIEGVVETLESIVSRGIQVAIVTARAVEPEKLREELRPTGILRHLNLIHTRPGDHIHWTDKTGTIKRACAELKTPVSESWMVGDIPADITSARTVGIGKAVAVLSGGIRREVLEKSAPDLIISDVTELKRTILVAKS